MSRDHCILICWYTDSHELREVDVTKSITVPDLSTLCHALSSSPLKKMPLLLLFKLHVAKLPGARRVIQLMPREKIPKNACTLETMLSGGNHPQAKTFQQLVNISNNDKKAWVYKIVQQILDALKGLYRILEQLRRTNQRVVCIHGLLKPYSIYRYPNGNVRLTYYGIANTLQPNGIYYDLCCMSSIFAILCNKLSLPPEVSKSFDSAIKGVENLDQTNQLSAVAQFIGDKLKSLSDNRCLTGHLTMQTDICTDLKDGAIDPAVSDAFVVDELESSSMKGVSASSQPRQFYSTSTIDAALVDSKVEIKEGNILIPQAAMDEIRERYHYLFDGSFPDMLYSGENRTMTTLFEMSNDRQLECPYLTYMSILSSKHPMQEIKRHLVDGAVLHALLRDEFLEVLRDQSSLTKIVSELLTDQRIVLQVLEVAFCGTNDSKEYRTLTPNERSQLHSNMPRLLRALLQTTVIAESILVTNANTDLDEDRVLALWAVLKKGINSYYNWVSRRRSARSDPGDGNNRDEGPNNWTVELANSCSACLRVYMHVAITSNQLIFTQQIDQNEDLMRIMLKFVKLSIFESTFHLYFRGRLCSHVLPNEMIIRLMEKGANGAFVCSATDTICVCELLIVYLIHNGISGFTMNSIGMLMSFLVDIFRVSVTNPLLEEHHKIPIITKVLLNYFIIHLSQVSVRLLKDTEDATNAKWSIKASFELLGELCRKLSAAIMGLLPIEKLKDGEDVALRVSLIYTAVDCITRIFHCVGGVEHLIVRTLENAHIGDEYAQVYKDVCMREEPIFLDYSNLPSTAMQGFGGPASWRGEEHQQNRKKLLPVYLGVMSLLNEDLAAFFRALVSLSAIENVSLIHTRLAMIRNMLVEAVHTVFQYDASQLSKTHSKAFKALGFKEHVKDIVQKHVKDAEHEAPADWPRGGGRTSLAVHHAFCTVRKMIELSISLDEVHVFYGRHLMCGNSTDRNDLPACPDDLVPLTRHAFLESVKALSKNHKFASLLHIFDLPYELVYICANCDSFYREIPAGTKDSILNEASSGLK